MGFGRVIPANWSQKTVARLHAPYFSTGFFGKNDNFRCREKGLSPLGGLVSVFLSQSGFTRRKTCTSGFKYPIFSLFAGRAFFGGGLPPDFPHGKKAFFFDSKETCAIDFARSQTRQCYRSKENSAIIALGSLGKNTFFRPFWKGSKTPYPSALVVLSSVTQFRGSAPSLGPCVDPRDDARLVSTQTGYSWDLVSSHRTRYRLT